MKELYIYSDESGQTNKAPFVSASIVTSGEINFFAKRLTKENFPAVKRRLKEIDRRHSKYVSIISEDVFEKVQKKWDKMNSNFKQDVPAPNYVWMHCRTQIIAQCLAKIVYDDFEKVNIVLHEKSLKEGAKNRFKRWVNEIAIDLMKKIIKQSPGGAYTWDGTFWRFKNEFTRTAERNRDKILFIWTQDEKHGGISLAHSLAGYCKIGLKNRSYIAGLEEVGVEFLDLSKDVSTWRFQ